MQERQEEFVRFISAQAPIYEQVLKELAGGYKESHWMWFIFPQLRGLAYSEMSRTYAIVSLNDARKYLGHELLGARLRQCTQLVLDVNGKDIEDVFGYVDAMKFHSCMTLFSLCSANESVFLRAIDKYFRGMQDKNTLQLLEDRHELPPKIIK